MATIPVLTVTNPLDVMETEQLTVQRALAGDQAAMRALWTRHAPHIDVVVRRLVGHDPDLAADIAQEVWIQIFRALPSFRGDAQFSTWLYRIAYTTFLNHVRRPHRLVQLDEEKGDAVPDPSPSSEELLAGGEARGRLRRAVMTLGEPLRFTLTAHYWAGLAPKEIARLEGITSVAVRKRLRKALSVLDTLLKEIER